MDTTLKSMVNDQLINFSSEPIKYIAIIFSTAFAISITYGILKFIVNIFMLIAFGGSIDMWKRNTPVEHYNLEGKDDFTTWYSKVYPAKSKYNGYDYQKGYNDYLKT